MSATRAAYCFKEIMDRLDPEREDEKFFLYQGLWNLARAVDDLSDDMRKLKR